MTKTYHQLVFIHVPKNAGTSFTHALKRTFGRNNVFHAGTSEETSEFRRTKPEDLRNYAILSGHITKASFLNKVPNAKCFAIIRDPYERAVSVYKHFSTVQSHPLYEAHFRLDFSQHLEWMLENVQVTNAISQVHYTGGLGGVNVFKVSELDSLLKDMIKASGRHANPFAIPNLNAINKNVFINGCDRELISRVYCDDIAYYNKLFIKS
jgi:hypothetical protein